MVHKPTTEFNTFGDLRAFVKCTYASMVPPKTYNSFVVLIYQLVRSMPVLVCSTARYIPRSRLSTAIKPHSLIDLEDSFDLFLCYVENIRASLLAYTDYKRSVFARKKEEKKLAFRERGEVTALSTYLH